MADGFTSSHERRVAKVKETRAAHKAAQEGVKPGTGTPDDPVAVDDPQVNATLIKIVTELIEAKELQDDYDKQAELDREGTFEEMAGIRSYLLRSILGAVSTEKAKEAFLGMAMAGKQLEGMSKFFAGSFAGLLGSLNDKLADQIDIQHDAALQAKITAQQAEDDKGEPGKPEKPEKKKKKEKEGDGFFGSINKVLKKFQPLAVLTGMTSLMGGGGFLAPILGLPLLLLGLGVGWVIIKVKELMAQGFSGGEAVEKITTEIWDGIIDFLLDITHWVTDKFRDLDFGPLTIAADLVDGAVEGILGIADAIGKWFGNAFLGFHKFGTALAHFDLAGMGAAAWEILQNNLKLIGNVLESIGNFIGDTFMAFFNTMLKDTPLGDLLQPVIDGVARFWGWLKEFFGAFDLTALQPGLLASWESVKETLVGAFSGMWQSIKETFLSVVTSIGDWLKSIAVKVVDLIISPVINKFNEIIETATKVFGIIGELFVGAKKVLGEAFNPEEIIDTVVTKAKEVFTFISDVFTKFFSLDFWKTTLRSIWAGATGKLGALLGGIGNFIFGSGTPEAVEVPDSAGNKIKNITKFVPNVLPSSPIPETKGGLTVQKQAAIMSEATMEIRARTIAADEQRKSEVGARAEALNVAPTVVQNVVNSQHHHSGRVSPHDEVFMTAMGNTGAKYAK